MYSSPYPNGDLGLFFVIPNVSSGTGSTCMTCSRLKCLVETSRLSKPRGIGSQLKHMGTLNTSTAAACPAGVQTAASRPPTHVAPAAALLLPRAPCIPYNAPPSTRRRSSRQWRSIRQCAAWSALAAQALLCRWPALSAQLGTAQVGAAASCGRLCQRKPPQVFSNRPRHASTTFKGPLHAPGERAGAQFAQNVRKTPVPLGGQRAYRTLPVFG
jgi:hypothetical protein